MAKKAKSAITKAQTAPYKHPEATSLMRPEVGTQAQFKKKKVYVYKDLIGDGGSGYSRVLLPDGTRRLLSEEERRNPDLLSHGSKIYSLDNLTSSRPAQLGDVREFTFKAKSLLREKEHSRQTSLV